MLRALQLANFTTPLLLDDDARIRAVLRDVPGIDSDAIVERMDDAEVSDAYERDKAEARSASGTAAEAQRKTSTSDGPVRFTAPTIVFERNGARLVAGGWQPILAYDVLVANLEAGLARHPAPDGPLPLLEHFPDGLTTAEVAGLLAAAGPHPGLGGNRAGASRSRRAREGERVPLGQDALCLGA